MIKVLKVKMMSSIEKSVGFNGVMYVNNEITNSLRKLCMDFGVCLIEECSREYGFSSEEAIRKLCLSEMRMEEIVYKVSNKSIEKRIVKNKKTKSAFPLPFSGEMLEGCCHGLKKNGGLYTQCEVLVKVEGLYCVGCQMQAEKNSNGKPDSGTIEDRLAVGLYEFRDPKGKMPISYRKLMSKLNLTDESVLSEGERMSRKIPLEHLSYVMEEKKKGRPSSGAVKEVKEGKKGRPKKSKKILEVDNESSDLFASLVAQANGSSVDSESDSDSEVNLSVISEQLVSNNEDSKLKEKEAKREAVEEEKAKKEAEKAKKEAEKKAKEEEKLKKEAEKKAKEAEKKAKEEEKEAKKQAAEAEKSKENEKKVKEVVKEANVDEKKKDDKEPDVVKRFEYEGKKYLKSKKTGVVYNMDQDVVGKFNEETQKIEFLEAESEEEEEDYESDDE